MKWIEPHSSSFPFFFRPFSKASPVRWSWVNLNGSDAKDFIHRLTTVNSRVLEEGSGQPGFFLTAQGKIRVYFTFWNIGKDQCAFEFDAGIESHWKNELLAVIDQYTFGERMTLEASSTEESIWIFPTQESLTQFTKDLGLSLDSAFSMKRDQNGMRFCFQGSSDFGRPWLTLWGSSRSLSQFLDQYCSQWKEVGIEDLEILRIQALRPWVDHEITQEAIPLELGLLDAIAENKGCYPGQEVIEKIISLGSSPRKLVKIEVDQSSSSFMNLKSGDLIFNLADPPQEVGKLTTVASSISGKSYPYFLGLVKKAYAKENLEVQFQSADSKDSSQKKFQPKGKIISLASYQS